MKLFLSHSQYSCESHFLERSLETIWTSNLEINPKNEEKINTRGGRNIKKKCAIKISKENRFIEKILQKLLLKLENILQNSKIKLDVTLRNFNF